MPAGAFILVADFGDASNAGVGGVAVAGMATGERWVDQDDPGRIADIHDVDSIDILRREACIAAARAASARIGAIGGRVLACASAVQILPGGEISPPNAQALLLNAMNVAPEMEDEFNAWYDQEHIPALRKVAGVLSARRFRSLEGAPRYFALYHLTGTGVVSSEAWKAAAYTPWEAKMRPLFADRLRLLARKHDLA